MVLGGLSLGTPAQACDNHVYHRLPCVTRTNGYGPYYYYNVIRKWPYVPEDRDYVTFGYGHLSDVGPGFHGCPHAYDRRHYPDG
jgi:hypothetical protein